MTPKYTDAARYPNGYVKADATDIRKTFARVRREQKELDQRNAEERDHKLIAMRKR